MSEPKMILKLDAPLYIDVTCWYCKRAVALSNAVQREGRYYCPRHDGWMPEFPAPPAKRDECPHKCKDGEIISHIGGEPSIPKPCPIHGAKEEKP